MTPDKAQTSTKKIASTATALEPSSLVTLYEIDISDLLANSERKVITNLPDFGKVLRFHNNVKLIESLIKFDGKEYHPAPIQTEGFETSAKGSPPTPKLTVVINPSGLTSKTSDRIKYLRFAIRDLDNLSGAKVTRIRTFAKYLDGSNFYNNYGASNQSLISNTLPAPEGFAPDPYAQFPQDIYYIDRKSSENKSHVQFELASPFDLQDLKLPGRIVTEHNCVWTYRGEGCCYEYDTIKAQDKTANGEISSIFYSPNNECKTPTNGLAPPVATFKNELFTGDSFLGANGINTQSRTGYTPGGLWNKTTTYEKRDFIRVNLKGVNYYFVAKQTNTDAAPPDDANWWADECSKTIAGCRLRFSAPLPIGAFPTSRRGGTD